MLERDHPDSVRPQDVSTSVPLDYECVHEGDAKGVVWAPLAPALRQILRDSTLYDYAGRQRGRRTLTGRGPAYAIAIEDTAIVVRHARHGGLLAPLTRDVFARPTRAPYELAVSRRLRELGVATPEVLASVLYRVAPGLCRVDVATREIPDAADLHAVLTGGLPAPDAAAALWAAVRVLIDDLGRAGAVHEDLNVKNVLIQHPADAHPIAHAIDIDRVRWRTPGSADVVRANWRRLMRSARKRGLATPALDRVTSA